MRYLQDQTNVLVDQIETANVRAEQQLDGLMAVIRNREEQVATMRRSGLALIQLLIIACTSNTTLQAEVQEQVQRLRGFWHGHREALRAVEERGLLLAGAASGAGVREVVKARKQLIKSMLKLELKAKEDIKLLRAQALEREGIAAATQRQHHLVMRNSQEQHLAFVALSQRQRNMQQRDHNQREEASRRKLAWEKLADAVKRKIAKNKCIEATCVQVFKDTRRSGQLSRRLALARLVDTIRRKITLREQGRRLDILEPLLYNMGGWGAQWSELEMLTNLKTGRQAAAAKQRIADSSIWKDMEDAGGRISGQLTRYWQLREERLKQINDQLSRNNMSFSHDNSNLVHTKAQLQLKCNDLSMEYQDLEHTNARLNKDIRTMQKDLWLGANMAAVRDMERQEAEEKRRLRITLILGKPASYSRSHMVDELLENVFQELAKSQERAKEFDRAMAALQDEISQHQASQLPIAQYQHPLSLNPPPIHSVIHDTR